MTRRGYSRRTLAWFVLAYTAFGWVFPTALALSGLRVEGDAPWVLLALLHVAAARLAWLSVVREDYRNLLDVAFWVFIYVFFGIAAVFQRLAGVFPWSPLGISGDELLRADLVLVFGVIAYVVGRVVAPRRGLRDVEASTGHRRVLMASIVVAVVWPLTYIALFGLDAIVVDRVTRGGLISDVAGDPTTRTFIGSLLSVPPMVLLPALLLLRGTTRYRRVLVLTVLGLIVANLVINNFVNSARYTSGTVLLASVFAFLVASKQRQRWLRFAPAAFIVGMTLVFPFADAFRSIYQRFEPRPVVDLLVAKGDYDAYLQIVNAVRYVDAHGVMDGVNIVGVAGFWVPRAVWPGKPRPTGEYLAEHAGFTYTNLSAPLWAEGFAAYGLLGVVLVLAAWGFVSGVLDASLRAHMWTDRRGVAPVVVLAVIMAAYALFLIRGALMPTVAYIVPVLLILAVLVRLRVFETQSDAR